MRKIAILALCLLTSAIGLAAPRFERPKLVLLLAIDQFRYDYLTRFDAEYKGGLRYLLDHGAVMAHANLEHYPSVTAIGHSTMLSGATPSLSGIVGNDWFDRTTDGQVTSVLDHGVKILGAPAFVGNSPHRLLVSTVADELKVTSPKSRVVGIALKARSAILPAGHGADLAFWSESGNFVTSTWYTPEMPAWAAEFNAKKMAAGFAGKSWDFEGGKIEMPAEVGGKLYKAIDTSPYGNDITIAFAETAIRAEKLGQRGVTDLLTVSLSSNDIVGHAYGPESPQVHDITIKTDTLLAGFFKTLDQLVGMQNVLVVMTADHGVAPVPEEAVKRRLNGGRMTNDQLFGPLKAAMTAKYGPGDWLLSTAGSSPYLNHKLIEQKGLDPAAVRRFAAQEVEKVPHVTRVFTRDQLLSGLTCDDPVCRRVARSYNSQRSGDLEILLEPYWLRSATGTTHGGPYNYDVHIPIIFAGPGINPGLYTDMAAQNDIAPTLSTMLGVEIPSGSVGRVLSEILQPAKATSK